MKIFVLFCLLTGSVLSVGAESAATVSKERCAIRPFQAEYDASAAVFVGEVVEVSQVENKKYFTFEIKKYWKGVKSEKIKLLVYENPRFQAPYEEGKTFLVFAKKDDDDVLFDSRCSRSAEIESSSSNLNDDLEALGEAKTCIDLTKKEGKELEKEND